MSKPTKWTKIREPAPRKWLYQDRWYSQAELKRYFGLTKEEILELKMKYV